MKLIRAMDLLALRPSLGPSWPPSPAERALSLVIGVSTPFCEVQAPLFHQDVDVLGVFESYTVLRQLESPVEIRGFMIIRLTDQRFHSSRTSWTIHRTSTARRHVGHCTRNHPRDPFSICTPWVTSRQLDVRFPAPNSVQECSLYIRCHNATPILPGMKKKQAKGTH